MYRLSYILTLLLLALPVWCEPDGPRYYYVGPWVWHEEILRWMPPAHVVGSVDLSPALPKEAIAGGMGFFSTDVEITGYTYLGDNFSDPVDIGTWESALNMDLPETGYTVLDALWYTLTDGADETQQGRCGPLHPTSKGVLELHLGGHSLVRSREWKSEADPIWPKIQKQIRAGYRELRTENGKKRGSEKTKDKEHIQRVLGALQRDYRIADWKQLVPADMQDWEPKKPATTYVETWPTASSTISSGQDLTWTELAGDTRVNPAGTLESITGDQRFRAEHAVSGANMYCKAQSGGVTANTGVAEVNARYSASAQTSYAAEIVYTGGDFYVSLVEWSAGSGSGIGSTNTTPTLVADAYIEVRCDGTNQYLYYNGTQYCTATDTTIDGISVGGLRFGGRFYETAGAPYLKRVEAGDIAAAGSLLLRVMEEGLYAQ